MWKEYSANLAAVGDCPLFQLENIHSGVELWWQLSARWAGFVAAAVVWDEVSLCCPAGLELQRSGDPPASSFQIARTAWQCHPAQLMRLQNYFVSMLKYLPIWGWHSLYLKIKTGGLSEQQHWYDHLQCPYKLTCALPYRRAMFLHSDTTGITW